MSVSISTSIAATTTSISVGKSAVAHPSAIGEGATPPTSPRCSLPFMNAGVDSSALLQQKITTFFAGKIDKARKSVDNAAVARGAQSTTTTTNRQRSLSPAAFPPLLSSLLLRFGGSADQFAANKQQQQLQQQNKCCCSSLGSSTTSSSVETTVTVSSADDDEEVADKISVVASTIEEKRNSIEASAPNAIEERSIDNDEQKQKTPVTECEVKILKEIQDGINDANLFLENKQISQRKESIQSLENVSRNSSVGSIGDLLQKQNCSVNTSTVSLISDDSKNYLLPQQLTSANVDCKKRYSSPQIVNGNNNPSVVPLIPPRRSFQGTECVEHTTSKEACQQFVKQLGPHQDGKDQQPKENSIKIITQNCPPMLKKVVEKQSQQSKRPPQQQQQRKHFLPLPTGLTTKQHEQQRRSISLSRHLIHTATRLSSTAAGHSLALATKVSTATATASGASRATSGQRTTASDNNNTPRPRSVNATTNNGGGTASSAATALAMFNQVRRISEPLQRQRRRFSSIMHGFTDEFFLLQQPNGRV